MTSQSQKGYNIVQDDIECALRLLNLASHAIKMKQRSDIIFPTWRRSVRTYARIKSTVLDALFRWSASDINEVDEYWGYQVQQVSGYLRHLQLHLPQLPAGFLHQNHFRLPEKWTCSWRFYVTCGLDP